MTDTPEAQPQEVVTVTSGGAGTATATVNREALDAETTAAQEAELLAGKFKTPADLEKAYKELEQKLGQKPQQPADADDETGDETGDDAGEDAGDDASDGDEEDASPYGKAVTEALAAAGVDPTAGAKEFEETGTLSEETFKHYEEAGLPRTLVEAYLRGIKAPAEEAMAREVEAKVLVQSQVDAIKASAGGDEGFAALQDFIRTQYTAEEQQAYNEAVLLGDFEAAFNAVTAARTKQTAEFGGESKLIGGKSAEAAGGYEDDSQMMADMRDPRYKKSQAFRDEVAAKIAKSTYQVMR